MWFAESLGSTPVFLAMRRSTSAAIVKLLDPESVVCARMYGEKGVSSCDSLNIVDEIRNNISFFQDLTSSVCWQRGLQEAFPCDLMQCTSYPDAIF
jgi:hypothetical protein